MLADKVIDLVGMRVDNGTQAQIWQDVFGENQLWSIQPVPDKLLQKDMPKPEPKENGPQVHPHPDRHRPRQKDRRQRRTPRSQVKQRKPNK